MWELLEESCSDLDFILARQCGGMDPDTFNNYSKAIEDIKSLREKLKVQQEHSEVLSNLSTYLSLNLPNPVNNPIIKRARKEALALEKTINGTVCSKLS